MLCSNLYLPKTLYRRIMFLIIIVQYSIFKIIVLDWIYINFITTLL